MNNRRKLFIVLGGCALVAPRMMFAQPKQAPVIIGWLNADSRESSAHYLNAFKEGLSAFGWKEGSQLVIEERWADARYGRLQSLTEELARKKAAVIVAAPLVSVHAAAKAAPTIPIVMATGGGDLVAAGLVKSLARPGGMITGLNDKIAPLRSPNLISILKSATLAELAQALGDPLRARAQARLAAATPAAQAAALEAERPPADARAIGLGVEALLEDVGQLRA